MRLAVQSPGTGGNTAFVKGTACQGGVPRRPFCRTQEVRHNHSSPPNTLHTRPHPASVFGESLGIHPYRRRRGGLSVARTCAEASQVPGQTAIVAVQDQEHLSKLVTSKYSQHSF
jgi:hypothetical protein